MKRLLLLIGMLAMPSFAGISANVSFATDYIWRGMTQTDGSAMQGGFDYEADTGFYAGIWGSNVNFGDGNGAELDYYAGYIFDLNKDLEVDIGYLIYDFPDSTPDAQMEEIYIGLSFGDLGVMFSSGQDAATDYLEFSYAVGSMSFTHGQYDGMGDNTTVSYSFGCGPYNCGITAYDFADEGYSSIDEDGIYFSIAASF